MIDFRRRSSTILVCLLITHGASGQATEEVSGISGVIRDGGMLLLVSDRSPRVFAVAVPPEWPVHGPTPFRGAISFATAEPRFDAGTSAADLEAIERLPNGSVVVLSERFAALMQEGQMLAFYPAPFAPIGGRGLEGLSAAADGRVATLWEGGWLNQLALPTAIDGVGALGSGPLQPIVCIHPEPVRVGVICLDRSSSFSLEVPAPPDRGHAFRATDLVWSADGDELIVLLASGNESDDSFRFRWLQRFTLTGASTGEPINLCDPGVLPAALRVQAKNNFEGLAWLDDEILVLVNDTSPPSSAVLIDVSPWPTSDQAAACEAGVADQPN